MAGTALRERPIRSELIEKEATEAANRTVLASIDEPLAFSALLREVLGDLRNDPDFLALQGHASSPTTSSLEPAA